MAKGIKIGIDKDMKKVLERLVKLGCTWRSDGSGHLLITTPQGDHYSWPQTPPNPGIAVKKARMIERRVRADSRRPTPGPCLKASDG